MAESLFESIPDGWRQTTLGGVCQRGGAIIQTGPFGSQLHASDYERTGVPVVPTEAIGRRRLCEDGIPRVSEATAERLARHKLKPGDILFARRGIQATGLSALVESQHDGWLCGTGAILLRLNTNDVDPTYLSFWLSSDSTVSWLKAHAVGAVMPNLNESVLRQLPVLLPLPDEQRAIASVLGSLDDKIELNRRMNETLEAMARAIFKSWFVDFDPVRAKMEGRKPVGMDAETAALFPDSFQDSPLGKIPKGWKAGKLGDIIDIHGGGTPKTTVAEYWGGTIPWFAVVDAPLPSDVFVTETEKTITDAGVDNSSAEVLPAGTTIISARGTVGKCAVMGVPMAMNECRCRTHSSRSWVISPMPVPLRQRPRNWSGFHRQVAGGVRHLTSFPCHSGHRPRDHPKASPRLRV